MTSVPQSQHSAPSHFNCEKRSILNPQNTFCNALLAQTGNLRSRSPTAPASPGTLFEDELIDSMPELSSTNIKDHPNVTYDEHGLIVDDEYDTVEFDFSPSSSLSLSCTPPSPIVVGDSTLNLPLCLTFQNCLYFFSVSSHKGKNISSGSSSNIGNPDLFADFDNEIIQWDQEIQGDVVLEFPQLDLILDERSPICTENSLTDILEAWNSLQSQTTGTDSLTSNEPLHVILSTL